MVPEGPQSRPMAGGGVQDRYRNIFETLERQLSESAAASVGRNRVLAINGVPGAGKTTFALAFQEHLASRGHDAVVIQADWLLAAVRLPLWKLPLAVAAGLLAHWFPRLVSIEALMRTLVVLFADPKRTGPVRAAFHRLAESSEAEGLEEILTIRSPDPAEAVQRIRLRKSTFVILEGALARTILGPVPLATLAMDVDAVEARRRLVERRTQEEGLSLREAEYRARQVASDLTVGMARRWSLTQNYVFALKDGTPTLTVMNPVPAAAGFGPETVVVTDHRASEPSRE